MGPASRLFAVAGLVAVVALPRASAAGEENLWPAFVTEKDDAGKGVSWTAAGPLFFSEPGPERGDGNFSGLRPFCTTMVQAGYTETDFLYPLFYFRQYPDATTWSLLGLVNKDGPETPAKGTQRFDLWPFYFSRTEADPQGNYKAVFPVYGTVRNRLGFSSLSWCVFPIYGRLGHQGTEITYTPWPFVRTYRGAEDGFALWPLFGSTQGPGATRQSFFLWPLVWNNTIAADTEAAPGTTPRREIGVLPFYSSEVSPSSVDENYLWPFFGYTETTAPVRYSERRYLWPFLVQGHGDTRTVEHWAPFYTHSVRSGVESTWVLWPLWHRTRWTDGDTAVSKDQFFYFLYWSGDQSSVSRPAAAPAFKRHIWPLLSLWDNGAGSRQLQFPSPLEVFFPDNRPVRVSWTPLFALYRYEHQPDGEERNSLLWNAVTWRRNAAGSLEEFHLGPLFGIHRGPEGGRWSILGFDFGSKQANPVPPPQ